MKKKVYIVLRAGVILFGICDLCSWISCTDSQIARKFGRTTEIRLEKGQKLLEATWKDNNLWYLTEPMDDDYTPKTKVFREDSNFGVLEGKVLFIESK